MLQTIVVIGAGQAGLVMSYYLKQQDREHVLLERAPDALERLYDGFVWDRQNEHDPMETPTTGYKVPMFSECEGQVSCRYNRNWMMKAANRNGRKRGFLSNPTICSSRLRRRARDVGLLVQSRPNRVRRNRPVQSRSKNRPFR